jgi:Spy/CpxP family protein refolding chaperone
MDYVTKSRWQVRLAAAVIFLLGFTAGILALNVYRGWARNAPPHDRFEQLAKRLELNADQKTRVQQIFGDTREQLRELRKESDGKVADIRKHADDNLQQVLTAEQWQQFLKIKEEARERRERGGGRDADR